MVEGNCKICGRYGQMEVHHMLHGSMRALAEEDGLTTLLCHRCHMKLHDTGWHDRDLQREAEEMWLLQDHLRSVNDFIARYGKNYL